MLRADGQKTDAKHSVRSSSEHPQRRLLLAGWVVGGRRGGRRQRERRLVVRGESQREVEEGSVRPPDPVSLHGLHAGRPVQAL